MAHTIGDLMDSLCIENIRLWHVEDERREHVINDDLTLKEAKELLDKVSKTNKARNSLIDQVNAALRVLIDKAADKDSTFELTAEELLGTGKNKHYKGEDA